ncbi:MAG: hypothetical protein Q8K82_21920 [Gemmatimonadaceae bacterium]|nr:hypothetical protein [Gemmatimonadaceae bacterium]
MTHLIRHIRWHRGLRTRRRVALVAIGCGSGRRGHGGGRVRRTLGLVGDGW